jgi:hypothetical protein
MPSVHRHQWQHTLLSESAELLSILAQGSHAYLVPVSYHSRRLVLASPNGPLMDRGLYSPSAVQELVDWCLVELQGTSDGRVPTFTSGPTLVADARGCSINITRTGVIAAKELQDVEVSENWPEPFG